MSSKSLQIFPSMQDYLDQYAAHPDDVHCGPSPGRAAALLGVSRARVWNLIYSFKLPAALVYEDDDGDIAYACVSQPALDALLAERKKSWRVNHYKAMQQAHKKVLDKRK